MNWKNLYVSWYLLVVIAGVAGLGGWCANIYKIITGSGIDQWGGMEIGRVIGVFIAPLGAVLGFF